MFSRQVQIGGASMKNIDSHTHTTGKSEYIDDILVPKDTLYGFVFYSIYAHGFIKKLNKLIAKKEFETTIKNLKN